MKDWVKDFSTICTFQWGLSRVGGEKGNLFLIGLKIFWSFQAGEKTRRMKFFSRRVDKILKHYFIIWKSFKFPITFTTWILTGRGLVRSLTGPLVATGTKVPRPEANPVHHQIECHFFERCWIICLHNIMTGFPTLYISEKSQIGSIWVLSSPWSQYSFYWSIRNNSRKLSLHKCL